MAIFQLFEQEENKKFTESFEVEETLEQTDKEKGSLLSTLMTRGCFLVLLIVAALWLVWSICLFMLFLTLALLTGFQLSYFMHKIKKGTLNVRRALVSILSLVLGLFSPSFAIMVGCTYFLMYDKEGMEEIVPLSLQAQFKNLFQQR